MADAREPFPLLDLPSPALLSVFASLPDLRDAVALSQACKELHVLGAAARRRHLCCAACGHAVLQPAAAFASDDHRSAPALRLPDGETWAVEEQHALPGCTLGPERRLDMFEAFYSLQVRGSSGAGRGCTMPASAPPRLAPLPSSNTPMLPRRTPGGRGPARRAG